MRPTVYAVVVTYNRKAMLVDCLRALARQTVPLAGVLVVDNASDDGTEQALLAHLGEFPPIDYLRLRRNGGGAEGFHYGVREARGRDAGWLWLMDDDCAPHPDCLGRLLGAPAAADPSVAALAPLVVTVDGRTMPLNRGWLRPRWLRSPIVGLAPEHARAAAVDVEFASLVGPLVRMGVARELEPPRRDFFIWFDDLEYCTRIRERGRIVLVPGSRIAHDDPRVLESLGLRALLREFARGYPFGARWKRIYGMRNLVWCGRRRGIMGPAHSLSFVLASALRGLLFEDRRRRTLRLTLAYAYDGWRGRFRNVTPARWGELADAPDPLGHLARIALRYDEDTAEPVRRLGAPAGRPS